MRRLAAALALGLVIPAGARPAVLERVEVVEDGGLLVRLHVSEPVTPVAHALPAEYSGRADAYIAISRAVEAILKGDRRILLTMATGTGKTAVAFQICWKLWNARWNCTGEHRRPRILFLADRNILVDDPKDKMFASFFFGKSRLVSAKKLLAGGKHFCIVFLRQSILQNGTAS